MERTVAWLGVALPEQVLFLLKSGAFSMRIRSGPIRCARVQLSRGS